MNTLQRKDFDNLIAKIRRGSYPSTTITLQGYTLVDQDIDLLLSALNSSPEVKSRITHIDLAKNSIEVLLLDDFPNLDTLKVNSNKIRILSLRNIPKMRVLCAGNNLLSNVSLSEFTKLQVLSIYCNSLSNLSLFRNKMLQELDVSFNRLTTLDLSHFTELNIAKIYANPLNTLYIGGTPLAISFTFTSDNLDMPSKLEAIKRHTLSHSGEVLDTNAAGVPQAIVDDVLLDANSLPAYFAKQYKLYSKNLLPDLLFDAQKVVIYLSVCSNLPRELAVIPAVELYTDRLRAYFLPTLFTLIVNPVAAGTDAATLELRQQLVRDYLKNNLEEVVLNFGKIIQRDLLQNTALTYVINAMRKRAKHSKQKVAVVDDKQPAKNRFGLAITPLRKMFGKNAKAVKLSSSQTIVSSRPKQ